MTGPGDAPEPVPSRLRRRLGLADAVVLGLGSMLGTGVFVVYAPAAARAGGIGLLIALGVAALVAFCNAMSSAQLAAVHPQSGGAYVYGRERLGRAWGVLAGYAFIAGKSASCAAAALAVGAYVYPPAQRVVAAGAVVLVVALNLGGIGKTVGATRVLVAFLLAVLGVVVAAGFTAGPPPSPGGVPLPGLTPYGVLGAAGLLFFAFAGYARIATLGEEVRDPARVIPRAIPLALGVTLVIYLAVALATLYALGPAGLAGQRAPLAAAVDASALSALAPLVRAGAAVAALASFLSLVAGTSRTVFAMAVGGDLPRWFAAVHPSRRVPYRAELAVGVAALTGVFVGDLSGAIGFSAGTVLLYYAIANASALRLSREERRWPRVVAVLGLVGCLTLAVSLPGFG